MDYDKLIKGYIAISVGVSCLFAIIDGRMIRTKYASRDYNFRVERIIQEVKFMNCAFFGLMWPYSTVGLALSFILAI